MKKKPRELNSEQTEGVQIQHGIVMWNSPKLFTCSSSNIKKKCSWGRVHFMDEDILPHSMNP